jgi:hypothetical protein
MREEGPKNHPAKKGSSQLRLIVLSTGLTCACLVAACSLPTKPRDPCQDSSRHLIEIAQRDRLAEKCQGSTECEFQVNEDRWGRCTVTVFFPGVLTGNFVTLVISDDGRVIERIPGI